MKDVGSLMDTQCDLDNHVTKAQRAFVNLTKKDPEEKPWEDPPETVDVESSEYSDSTDSDGPPDKPESKEEQRFVLCFCC